MRKSSLTPYGAVRFHILSAFSVQTPDIPRFRTPQHPLAEYDERDLELRNWRATVEHVIGRLKSFAVLQIPFRQHDTHRHEIVFRVLCKLFNYSLLEEPVQIVNKPGLILS